MLCRSTVACMGVDVVRGPRGERNRDFKQDRYTCETKELLAIAPAVRSKRFWPRSSCVDSRRQTHRCAPDDRADRGAGGSIEVTLLNVRTSSWCAAAPGAKMRCYLHIYIRALPGRYR